MSNDFKCMCCSEFDNIKQLLDSKKCVTVTTSFEKIILDEEILNITRQQMIMKTKNKLKKKQLSALEVLNKTWKYICYVQFTHWVNSWTSLGKGIRVVIPTCVINKIRNKYLEKDGLYMGFKKSNTHLPS
ncbi:uncharacterized protein LOC112690288 [Sipha flava]|uniref:Uncharacterized protein LOC112690288 n=1 Tax=Sipha flava TaxID=143950 RepID=A0A8B8GAX0_9HEMI|nr:uncharacterized protein LOC112690288 [Sipha flava]